MRLKHKANKPREPSAGPSEAHEAHAEDGFMSDAAVAAYSTVADLTAALRNCRRFMANAKMNINYEGIDAAIAKGEASLRDLKKE